MPPIKEVVDQCLGGGVGGTSVVIGMGETVVELVVGFSLDVVVNGVVVELVVVFGVVGSGEGDTVVVGGVVEAVVVSGAVVLIY